MSGVTDALRHTTRRLAAAPIFSLFAAGTVAVSVGAATAVFSLLHAFMGPPPGVPDVDRVVEVRHFHEGSGPMMNLAWEDYQDLRSRQTVFESLTGWNWFRAGTVANGTSETVVAESVDGDYFRTIRPPMHLGRSLQPTDDRPDASPAAVISFTLWSRAFASSPDVVGKTIKVNGPTFEVVGVTAPEFTGLFNGGLLQTSVWVPMNVARVVFPDRREDFTPDSRNRRWLFVRGRLADEETLASAGREVAAIAKQLDAAYPLGTDRAPRFRAAPWSVSRPWSVRPMNSRMLGVPDRILGPFIWGIFASVALVLLVACTNLGNLMVARHAARRSATAVRAALGASRRRLAVEASIEPLVLVLAGGAGGLLVARLLMVFFSTEIDVGNGSVLQVLPKLDLAAFGAALGATTLSFLVAGVLPALQAARGGIKASMSQNNAGAAPKWRGRRYLIAAQVTVSVLFVAIAVLLGGELLRQSRIDTGVDLERLALAQINFGKQQYDQGRARQVVDAALRTIEARTDVEGVAVSSGLPFGTTTTFGATLRSLAAVPTTTPVQFVTGTPATLDVLGVALTRGRGIDVRDTAASAPVIVLSAKAASSVFGDADPLGHQLVFERRRAVGEPEQAPKTLTVIGVSEDTDAEAAGMKNMGVAWLSLDQHYEGGLLFVARTAGDPAPLVGHLSRVLGSIDPELAVARAGTGVALASRDTTFQRLLAGMAVSLGTIALGLALAGLYGVLSHVVAGRTREIGIQLALGAGQRLIRRMVIVEGLSPVVLGLVAGLGLGLIARAGMQPLFREVLPVADLGLMITVPVLFIAAGLGACYLPARRASRVDPNVALRDS